LYCIVLCGVVLSFLSSFLLFQRDLVTDIINTDEEPTPSDEPSSTQKEIEAPASTSTPVISAAEEELAAKKRELLLRLKKIKQRKLLEKRKAELLNSQETPEKDDGNRDSAEESDLKTTNVTPFKGSKKTSQKAAEENESDEADGTEVIQLAHAESIEQHDTFEKGTKKSLKKSKPVNPVTTTMAFEEGPSQRKENRAQAKPKKEQDRDLSDDESPYEQDAEVRQEKKIERNEREMEKTVEKKVEMSEEESSDGQEHDVVLKESFPQRVVRNEAPSLVLSVPVVPILAKDIPDFIRRFFFFSSCFSFVSCLFVCLFFL
jgi:hypothetical protein